MSRDVSNPADAGLKFDKDKLPVDLVDVHFTRGVASVLAFGAEKYGRDNWRKGISYTRLIRAATDHINSFAIGADVDAESGLDALLHAGCSIMFLWWMSKYRPDKDDRWFKDPAIMGEMPAAVADQRDTEILALRTQLKAAEQRIAVLSEKSAPAVDLDQLARDVGDAVDEHDVITMAAKLSPARMEA